MGNSSIIGGIGVARRLFPADSLEAILIPIQRNGFPIHQHLQVSVGHRQTKRCTVDDHFDATLCVVHFRVYAGDDGSLVRSRHLARKTFLQIHRHLPDQVRANSGASLALNLKVRNGKLAVDARELVSASGPIGNLVQEALSRAKVVTRNGHDLTSGHVGLRGSRTGKPGDEWYPVLGSGGGTILSIDREDPPVAGASTRSSGAVDSRVIHYDTAVARRVNGRFGRQGLASDEFLSIISISHAVNRVRSDGSKVLTMKEDPLATVCYCTILVEVQGIPLGLVAGQSRGGVADIRKVDVTRLRTDLKLEGVPISSTFHRQT
mmetsp:Transcript_20731/g.38718  ORF Transcript_20731/g.38718 Transcript_20731/m.38718 type:complete len:320 (-) Transcript_20731:1371-2330(-)